MEATGQEATDVVATTVRVVASVLLALQAALLVAAVPGVALMMLGSMWEGGDEAFKHRILDWGIEASLGNVVAVVLLVIGATWVARDARSALPLLTATSVLLAGLGVVWILVLRQTLTDPGWLGLWAALTLPCAVATALVVAGVKPPPSAAAPEAPGTPTVAPSE